MLKKVPFSVATCHPRLLLESWVENTLFQQSSKCLCNFQEPNRFVVLLFLRRKIFQYRVLYRIPGSFVWSPDSHFAPPCPRLLKILRSQLSYNVFGLTPWKKRLSKEPRPKRHHFERFPAPSVPPVKLKWILRSTVSLSPETQNQYLTFPLEKIMPPYVLCLFLIAQHDSFVPKSFFLGSALLLAFIAKEACLDNIFLTKAWFPYRCFCRICCVCRTKKIHRKDTTLWKPPVQMLNTTETTDTTCCMR